MSNNPGQIAAFLSYSMRKSLVLFSKNRIELQDSSVFLPLKRGSLSYSREPSCE